MSAASKAAQGRLFPTSRRRGRRPRSQARGPARASSLRHVPPRWRRTSAAGWHCARSTVTVIIRSGFRERGRSRQTSGRLDRGRKQDPVI